MIRASSFVLAVVASSTISFVSETCAQEESPIPALVKSGISMPGGTAVVLEPPQLAAGMSPEKRMSVLESLAGKSGWKRFSRNSSLAPVSIQMQSIKDSNEQRIGHQIHSCFVVHASLETLRNRDKMKQMLNDASGTSGPRQLEAGELPADQLSKFGVSAIDGTTFNTTEIPLMKKVLIRGILKVQQFETDDEIDMVFELDSRFNNERETNNVWSRIQGSSDLTLRPFDGAAGFARVSRLSEIENACLIEMRIVFHEPKEWFGGSNLLRSKLPLMIQESAQKFRRKLK